MFGKRHSSQSGASGKTPSSGRPAPESGQASAPGPLRTPPMRPFRRTDPAQRTVEAATLHAAQPARPGAPGPTQPTVSQPTPSQASGAGPVEPVPAAPAEAQADSASSAGRSLLVGRDIELRGAIKFCERLIIEGRVEGEVSETEVLEIGAEGCFSGTAAVERCVIAGRIEGELTVTGLLRLRSGAALAGKLRYGEIEIARGARLAGDIDQIQAAADPAAPADKARTPARGSAHPAETRTGAAKAAATKPGETKAGAPTPELALGRT